MAQRTRAPARPPTNCAPQYPAASRSPMRPETTNPSVTAGLTFAPETGPSVYASARSTRPNARAVATTPAEVEVPANLQPKLTVATPTPTITRIAVPRASATSFRCDMNVSSVRYPEHLDATVAPPERPSLDAGSVSRGEHHPFGVICPATVRH